LIQNPKKSNSDGLRVFRDLEFFGFYLTVIPPVISEHSKLSRFNKKICIVQKGTAIYTLKLIIEHKIPPPLEKETLHIRV
jgi:hypothetical protein